MHAWQVASAPFVFANEADAASRQSLHDDDDDDDDATRQSLQATAPCGCEALTVGPKEELSLRLMPIIMGHDHCKLPTGHGMAITDTVTVGMPAW
jgi:hypothetical protein